MNSDSEDRILVLLRSALGRFPANRLTPQESGVLSSAYLGLSLSICGYIELLRLMARDLQ